MENLKPDPNKERNDPMVPEFWLLGEDVQDKIRAAGYESESVEGIAVDFHDLLQAAEKIQSELGPSILASVSNADLKARLDALAFELEHVRWHCDAALSYLDSAREQISS